MDNRSVALIKSLETKNRFYALVTPESGIRNAETVERIPEDLLLGIAYPCLEDGLNDFAVIRTTFETLDYFPPDDPVRDEMREIIDDARSNLTRRLKELRDRIKNNTAIFLGTDYNEFKGYALDIATRGYPRRNLDAMMKLNVFGMVANEGGADGNAELYRYDFALPVNLEAAKEMPAREFIVLLFEDTLHSVLDDTNYTGRFVFDKNVFQKFIAVMFVNYATTDPMFYGINRQDYAVSAEKDMDETPLYLAIRKELTAIEVEKRNEHKTGATPSSFSTSLTPGAPPTFAPPSAAPVPANNDDNGGFMMFGDGVDLPQEIRNEEALMGHVTSICSAAALLLKKGDPDTERFARLILTDAARLVEEMKELKIIPPQANNPGLVG